MSVITALQKMAPRSAWVSTFAGAGRSGKINDQILQGIEKRPGLGRFSIMESRHQQKLDAAVLYHRTGISRGASQDSFSDSFQIGYLDFASGQF